MVDDLSKQYNKFTNEFIEGTNIHNEKSRKAYYSVLERISLENKKILDIGCGDGYDIKLLQKNNSMYGLDSSKKFVDIAQKNNPEATIIHGTMEQIPCEDEFFDLVLSKYVLQTSTNIFGVLKEIDRILKPGGNMIYLTVHPLRQFLEKKKNPKDYFKQEVVKSVFFGGTVTAHEPTHTMQEYLNPDFLKNYTIKTFEEHTDFPSAERIKGNNYPCYFILNAKKNK